MTMFIGLAGLSPKPNILGVYVQEEHMKEKGDSSGEGGVGST